MSAWQRTNSRDSFGFAQDRLFDAPSVPRFAGSFVLAQDDRVRGCVETKLTHCQSSGILKSFLRVPLALSKRFIGLNQPI